MITFQQIYISSHLVCNCSSLKMNQKRYNLVCKVVRYAADRKNKIFNAYVHINDFQTVKSYDFKNGQNISGWNNQNNLLEQPNIFKNNKRRQREKFKVQKRAIF